MKKFLTLSCAFMYAFGRQSLAQNNDKKSDKPKWKIKSGNTGL